MGWSFMITGIVIILAIVIFFDSEIEGRILGYIVGGPPVFIAYLLLRKSKKYSAEDGESVLKKDTRAPILYLRSFNDESEDQTVKKYFKSAFVSPFKDLSKTTHSIGLREHDALGYVFRKVGPYIALGKPGEELPELGASKIYVPDESWKNTILNHFIKSKLIVFRAGKTEGLKWELSELIQRINPQKLVILLPLKDEDYLDFAKWANKLLPIPFPSNYPASRIVIFDSQWNPSYLKPRHTITKSFLPFFIQNDIKIKETFWEIYLEDSGLRW